MPKSSIVYDVVFIGSGISCTLTLTELLRIRVREESTIPLSILVIEKNVHLWTGIPYGKRSSNRALTITTLGEFLHPDEKVPFYEWFMTRKEDLIHQWSLESEGLLDSWFIRHKEKILSNQLDELYLPRHLYGDFLKEQLAELLDMHRDKPWFTVETLNGEAFDLDKSSTGYKVRVHQPGRKDRSIKALKVILTIGHLGKRPVEGASDTLPEGYFSDPYSPSMDSNLALLRAQYQKTGTGSKNILLIGSNAGAVELIYLLMNDPFFFHHTNKLVVISPSGRLPSPIHPAMEPGCSFPHLVRLKEQKVVDADRLMEAINNDVEWGLSTGVHIGDCYHVLSALVVDHLKALSYKEKKKFHNEHGINFTRLIRRSGADYSDVATRLAGLGKLELLKGRVEKLEAIHAGKGSPEGCILHYIESKTKLHVTYSDPFVAIFNCSGYESLQEVSSPLLQQVVHKKLGQVNSNGRGFLVSDTFEASKNLYIMGPLLGSLFTESYQYWHVENAKRLKDLTTALAKSLMKPSFPPFDGAGGLNQPMGVENSEIKIDS